MNPDYLDIVRKACERFGYFPSVEEFNAWAKENGFPGYQRVMIKVGGFRAASAALGVKPKDRILPKRSPNHAKYLQYDVPVISHEEYSRKRHAYLNQKEIATEFGCSYQRITELNRTGNFPKPAFKVYEEQGRGTYWNRREVEEFFKNDSPGLAKQVTSIKRREELLKRAREIFVREDVKSPHDYIKKARGKGFIDPTTLWAYSITFEDVVGVEQIRDPVMRDIINLLNEKRTISQLAQTLMLSGRTVQRKINALKASGVPVCQERGVVWIEQPQ